MAVQAKVGNLFESNAQTWVNTVNTVGVMGKGVALEFKKRFPDMFTDYVRRCNEHSVRLGEPYLFKNQQGPWVLNFPTKQHWRDVSRLDAIIRGLEYLEKHYQEWGIRSLAVPPLGCGLGQLDWAVVGPTLFQHLNRLPIPVELYAPHGTPPEQLKLDFLAAASPESSAPRPGKTPIKIQPSWLTLAETLFRLEQEPYHWPVGRTTFQKIAYFLTREGVPTGLNFARGSYGPFSRELKPVIGRLMNNGVIVEQHLGRMFRITVGPTYSDAQQQAKSEIRKWEEPVTKVVDLFTRMTTQDAEIAATVHFIAQELSVKGCPSELDVLKEVQEWKQHRRPPLKTEEIAKTIRNLNILRWVNLEPSKELPVPKDTFADA